MPPVFTFGGRARAALWLSMTSRRFPPAPPEVHDDCDYRQHRNRQWQQHNAEPERGIDQAAQ
jgi:hypothetical protein